MKGKYDDLYKGWNHIIAMIHKNMLDPWIYSCIKDKCEQTELIKCAHYCAYNAYKFRKKIM